MPTPIVEAQLEAQARATGVPVERVLEDVLLAPQAVKRLLAPVVTDHGWTAR